MGTAPFRFALLDALAPKVRTVRDGNVFTFTPR